MLLEEVGRHLPRDAWLVTYNGRGFDWPLLVTRYRMARRAAPEHAGHLDLLPLVRRLFRHRMDDARLGTVERMLLGVAAPRRRRRLGDPRPIPRVPARRPRAAAGGGRPPQRRGRPVARAAAGPRRAAVGRSGGAHERPPRRPRRAGPGVSSRATVRGGGRLPRRGAGRRSVSADRRHPRHATRPRSRSPASRRNRGGRHADAPTSAAGRRHDGRRQTAGIGDRPSPVPGTRPASPPTARTCSGDWDGSTRPSRPGMRSPVDRDGPRSSPRSRRPSCASIAWATWWPRWPPSSAV